MRGGGWGLSEIINTQIQPHKHGLKHQQQINEVEFCAVYRNFRWCQMTSFFSAFCNNLNFHSTGMKLKVKKEKQISIYSKIKIC